MGLSSLMYHDAVNLKYLDNFRLAITFDDGKSGVLDCRPFIEKGGVFSVLADPKVFKKVEINKELGVVTWNNEIDIAPETAYSLATGAPLPEWMEKSENNVVCEKNI
jgi:hypothetical protein